MVKNILIILVPEELGLFYGKNIPPMELGILKSYLENNNNNNVSILDLYCDFDVNNIKLEKGNFFLDLLNKEFVIDQLNANSLNEELENNFEPFLNKTDIHKIDAIGISIGSGISFFEIHFAFLLAKYIQLKYDKPIIFGGINLKYIYMFNDLFSELWKSLRKNFTFFIKGPGEVSLAKLLNALGDEDMYEVYKNLEGAIYWEDDKLIANSEAKPTFTLPDFTGLNLISYTTTIDTLNHQNNIKNYFWYPSPFGIKASNRLKATSQNKEDILFLPYVFNFYCPYNCAFCEQSEEIKSKPYSKPAQQVILDIKHLMNTYNSQYFYFFNNTFNYSKQFVIEFCNSVIEQKLEFYWSDCARVNGLSKELLELMYRAGCRKLIFGFETGSFKLLKYINKQINIDDLVCVLNWCKEIGIAADLEVIVGFPYEFEDEFYDTYNFLEKNKNIINIFHLNRYFVVPNTLMWVYPQKYKIDLKIVTSYDEILDRNRQVILNNLNHNWVNDDGQNNFHIYSFDETQGRNYEDISIQTRKKYQKLKNLQISFPLFKEAVSNYSL
ncbi:MAG: radical SAM protein [Bacteroidales bacterium]|nr:radical SAM protein [Bacteroidales bacterium]